MSELNVISSNGVVRLQFNRPSVLNALSPDLLNAIIDTCTNVGKDDSIRVVLLEGSGKHFSAGADLPAFHKDLISNPQATADLGRRATEAIAALPQIAVAAIRGHCVGGALVLAAACDVRIAADDSRYFIPELDAGIPLAWGGMAHMVRLVGESLAADLVLTCRRFDADDAIRSGFVSQVVAADKFDDAVTELTRTIASKPGLALRISKQQLIAIRNGNFDARNDAGALLSSLQDAEARQASDDYIASRLS
ncbi:MAG: enoyl-CoA hydratase/isomerase family protein [Gammaproteobacteria bacterium]|nr:enoyl-CoA hydratase/isomerase family protein [Gammaproteobacteria bacterium]